MSYMISVIPGDGIGTEVAAEAILALEQFLQRRGLGFELEEYPYS